MLQGGFGKSAAKKRGREGDPRLKGGGHQLLLLLLLHTHAAPRRPPNHSQKKIYVHKRDLEFPFNGIYQRCLPWAMRMHTSCRRFQPSTARELWGAGGGPSVMTATPKDITRSVPGLENAVLGTVPHDLQPR